MRSFGTPPPSAISNHGCAVMRKLLICSNATAKPSFKSVGAADTITPNSSLLTPNYCSSSFFPSPRRHEYHYHKCQNAADAEYNSHL